MIKKYIEEHYLIFIIFGLTLFVSGGVIGGIGLFLFHNWNVYLVCFVPVGIGFYLTFAICTAEVKEA